MAKHARFGPSSLDALSKCIRFKYSDVDEDAATEGTELHAAVETGNLNGLEDEQRDAVQAILDYIDSLMAGDKDWMLLKEARVQLEDLTFGTSDVILVHKTKTEVHVIDAKFTRADTDHSFQIRTYGAAVVETLQRKMNITNHDGVIILHYDDVDHPIEAVTTHVVSPRTRVIDTATYQADELLTEVRRDIEELYARIDEPFNPPTPHDELCTKCARASKCPALSQVVLASSQELGLALPAQFDPTTMDSAEDRARAQVLAGAFLSWADQIKKANNEYAKEGGDIPGFKLRTRSTGMRLPKEFTGLAIERLVEAGYDRHTIIESCSLVLGSLAKSLSQDSDKAQADIKEHIRELLGDFVTESQTEFLQKAKRITDEALLKQLSEGSL